MKTDSPKHIRMPLSLHRLLAGLLASFAFSCLTGCKPAPSELQLQQSNLHLSSVITHLQRVGNYADSEVQAAAEVAVFYDQLRRYPVPLLVELSDESRFTSWSNQFFVAYSQKCVVITNEIARIRKMFIEKPDRFTYLRPLNKDFPTASFYTRSSMPSLMTNTEGVLFFLSPPGMSSSSDYCDIGQIANLDLVGWFNEVKEMSAKWSPKHVDASPQNKPTN
jgi:hypothetical protein